MCMVTSMGFSLGLQSSSLRSSLFQSWSRLHQSSSLLLLHHSPPLLPPLHQSSSSSASSPEAAPSRVIDSGFPAIFWPCRSARARRASAALAKLMVAPPLAASSSGVAISMPSTADLPLTAPWKKSRTSFEVQRRGKPSSRILQTSSSLGGSRGLLSPPEPSPRLFSVFSADVTRRRLPLSSTSCRNFTASLAISGSAYSQKP
mmetsp:Transcript_39392/g.117928  ORF Transcript_39392/g.117928 Transcript_39392/m.117928 type:complete len:203 (+) Transcript_39392:712-1320(+)